MITQLLKVLPRPVKQLGKKILTHPACSSLFAPFRGELTCLMYHRVNPQEEYTTMDDPFVGLSIHPDQFERHLQYYTKHYNCLGVEEAIEGLLSGRLPEKAIILTFDDGYRDNYLHAYPLLKKYNVPATIFVTTGLIDGTCTPWWFEQRVILFARPEVHFTFKGRQYFWKLNSDTARWRALREINDLTKSLSGEDLAEFLTIFRGLYHDPSRPLQSMYDGSMLSWDEIRLIDADPLITIGAHTVTHPALSKVSKSTLQIELEQSKLRLEKELGHSVDYFAYPFGGRNECGLREFEAAAQTGFKAAFTTRSAHVHYQHIQSLLALPRITIDSPDSFEDLRRKLSGVHACVCAQGQIFVTE